MESNTQINILNKNIRQKAHTDNNKNIQNETNIEYLQLPAASLFAESIPIDTTQAITEGIVELVYADLILDITSNGHAYFAIYPIGHANVGERVTNSVNDYFGDETSNYRAIPYVDTGMQFQIAIGDPRNWIYQYNSGVFFQENNIGITPKKIQLHVYTGHTVGDLILKQEKISSLNVDMDALETANDGDLGCNTSILVRPVNGSNLSVIVNTVEITNDSFFFSPDGGGTIRSLGTGKMGDKMYWNGTVAGYELETDDKITFKYLISEDIEK